MNTLTQYFIANPSSIIGLLEDLSHDEFPAKLYRWNDKSLSCQNSEATYFGFVMEGKAVLTTHSGQFTLTKGMYFSVPSGVQIQGGQGFMIEQMSCKGFFQIGGPVENKGRLRYIDGCTDSLLIAPPVLGDPCLNLLHIPPHTFQTQHTHPSFRMGMIIKGKGTCITPEGEHQLAPGLIFTIPAHALHSFKTKEESLLVIAYHPDSDFGPTHENHPMINRTIV